MTRIDFYILEGDGPADRRRFACRLAEKAFTQGHRVYIHVDDPGEVERLDELLWTFRGGSFVPHQRLDDGMEAPVLIGCGEAPEAHHDVLLNLSGEVPLFFSRFERVAEVVDGDPEYKARAREHFRFYRERGYSLDSHTISQG